MEKLLSYKDLKSLGLGTQITIWRKVKEDNFPKPIKLGRRAVGWRSSDIEKWLKDMQEDQNV